MIRIEIAMEVLALLAVVVLLTAGLTLVAARGIWEKRKGQKGRRKKDGPNGGQFAQEE